MADILIRGMEMPKYCSGCPLQKDNLYTGHPLCMPRLEPIHVNFSTGRDDFCPLVPLPEGHGRLVDEKWIKNAMITTLEALMKHPIMDKQESHLIAAFDTLRVMLDDAPTIVPAEGGSDDEHV